MAMDCCAGMGDEDAPPCHCSLKPVPPAPAVVASVDAPAAVLAEATLPAVEVEVPRRHGRRDARRSCALVLRRCFLLFSVFLV